MGRRGSVVPIAALFLLLAGCASSAGLTDGSSVQFSDTAPRVLIVAADPVRDPPVVAWSGVIRYLPECECVVLLESGAKDTATFIAWQPGTLGYFDAATAGVALPDGRRLADGERATGVGTRSPYVGTAPARLPPGLRPDPDCLVVTSVD